MKKETRNAVYDSELRVEAYRFEGIAQPFLNHFHEHYVIGLVEDGERSLICQNREYAVKKGDILLFHPGDSHACIQCGGTLDYRGINIPQEVMLELAEEVTGRRELPGFTGNVIADKDLACCLRLLHEQVMRGGGFGGEESLLVVLSLLLREYGHARRTPACREEVEKACAFMERHYAQRISLDQLCRCAGLSKSTLLRAFTKEKGVTPYSYLKNIRISRAKQLLEQGVIPAEAALRTGFSDQSHFSGYFTRLTGLTPGVYRHIFLEERGK